MKIKTCFSQKPQDHFQPKVVCNLLGNENSYHDADGCHAIYGKNTLKKIFSPGTSWPISKKLGMKQWRLEPIIFCSNDNPVLTLTYFMARSNFATQTFIWENMTMIGSLEIIASRPSWQYLRVKFTPSNLYLYIVNIWFEWLK